MLLVASPRDGVATANRQTEDIDMGCVFRQSVNRPLPATATITMQNGREVARWRNRAGKWKTADVVTRPDGRKLIKDESSTYHAKYRGADGIIRTVPTGCRTEDAARQALARLMRDAERVRVGIATPSEIATADAATGAVARAIDDYLATLTGEAHRKDTGRYLRRLATAFRWQRLVDLRREDLERWLAAESRPGEEGRPVRSARTRNAHIVAVNSFCNWLVVVNRITANPFARMPKANTDADRRRPRRALTPAELVRLVDAARKAPERPPLRPRTGNGKPTARPAERLSGARRAEVYTVLAQTGLRVGELARLTVADVCLDGRVPHISLSASITKNGRDDIIPLRADLVDLLRARVEGRPAGAPLYPIPKDLIRRFHADCRRAGIPRTDDRGRVVDIHALRTTFGTGLAAAGVPLITAQKLMRHSDPKLTANVYTDPRLLDMAGAVEALSPIAPTAFVTPTVTPTQSHSGVTESSASTRRRRSGTA